MLTPTLSHLALVKVIVEVHTFFGVLSNVHTIVAVWWLCLQTIGVTVAHRLFLRHLGHVISVTIARRLCLRLSVTIAMAFCILNGYSAHRPQHVSFSSVW